MRENEFERKVQEQLEELRIRPSDETWERVEKELKEKKRRRAAVLFFLLPGLLLLGYFGYTFINKNPTQPVAQTSVDEKHSTTVTPDNSTATAIDKAVAEKPITTPVTGRSNEGKSTTPSLKKEPGASTAESTAESTAPEKARRDASALSLKVNPRSSVAKNIEHKQKKALNDQEEINPATLASNEQPVAAISNSITIQDVETNSLLAVDSTATVDSAIAKTTIDKPASPAMEEPEPELAVKNNNSSKWKFGVELSGGLVSTRDKVFGIDLGGEKSIDLQSNLNSGGVTSGAGQTGRVITPPAAINPGMGWKLGVTAEKSISKRSSISIGLRYSRFNESLEVGSIKDTVIRTNTYSFAQNYVADRGVRGAYNSSAAAPPASQAKYTNRYHFLELPVSFQTLLNKGKKMGIQWNGGIAPGYLVGTNALVYDSTAGGVYYKNARAFKHFHFNVQTGLALLFGNNKKMQWSVGPTISLDMSRLMKEDVFTDKRYFLYAGLTGRLFLSPRKK